jgi:hypothetical protein
MHRARGRGASVLVGRCWEAGGAPVYWPWVQSLRTYVRQTEPDALRADVGAGGGDLAQILPELRELLPGLPEPVALDSEGARFRLFDAGGREPGAGDPAARARGLSEGDVAAYTGEAAAEIASPQLAAALHEQTEGNPLFLAETVRLLPVEGPGAAPAIPESVREVIRRRLGHLGQDCNRLLVLAAVLGREFSLDALAGLAEVSADRLLDTLDEAMLARASWWRCRVPPAGCGSRTC